MQAVCSWPVCYWPLEYYWMSLLLQLYLNTEFIHAVRYSCIWSFLSSYHTVALYKYILSDHVTCSRYITITATRLNNTRLLIAISSINVMIKVIIANNNNNNKNSNSSTSTSCVGYLQSSE